MTVVLYVSHFIGHSHRSTEIFLQHHSSSNPERQLAEGHQVLGWVLSLKAMDQGPDFP